MRKILLLLFLIQSVFLAQEFNKTLKKDVTNGIEGFFMAPVFSPDDSKLFFTSGNYSGVWYYDIKNNAVKNLNYFSGAGYQPAFSVDGRFIIMRVDTLENFRKFSSLVLQDIRTGESKVLLSHQRHLSPPKIFGNVIFYGQDGEIKRINFDGKPTEKNLLSGEHMIFTENGSIAVFNQKGKSKLTPLGEGNYVWPSLSPLSDKLLFRYGAFGTLITDLEGKILLDIGNANAPVWSPDGNRVLYMDDKDNGYDITESDIYVISADGYVKHNITNTKSVIELYPVWSVRGDKIAWCTGDGKVEMITVEFKD
ncbi:MAG: hypothetical protein K9G57_15230 [Ignavibacteriales bacterium]|nr:hypothetical protein [Ignavibacteriales bacterium]MCF8438198.1 hypothetical protein [Ignavibacteriales bacterium]